MDCVRIMVTRHASFYSPLLAAIAGPFLAEQGIQAEYRISTPTMTVPSALRSGEIDLGQLAVSASWADMEQDWPNDLWHFAQINCRDGFFLVARDPDHPFSWLGLAAKHVLVDHLGQPLAMFRYACHREGIDFDAIEVQNFGEPDQMIAAFKAGKGDYIHLQGPMAQQLEFEGHGVVVARVGESIGPVAFSSLVSRHQWLRSELAGRFIQGYAAARRFVCEGDAETVADTVAKFFEDTDRSALVRSISAYHELGCWGGDLPVTETDYESALDVFMHSGAVSLRHPYHLVVAPPPGTN